MSGHIKTLQSLEEWILLIFFNIIHCVTSALTWMTKLNVFCTTKQIVFSPSNLWPRFHPCTEF